MSQPKRKSPLTQPLARLAAAQIQIEKAQGFVRIAQDDESTELHVSLLKFVDTALSEVTGRINSIGQMLSAIDNEIEARR